MKYLIAALAVLLGATGVAAAEDTARASLGGNEFVAGGSVELDGNVRRSAFASGGDVTVTATIGRDLYAAGGTLRVAPEASVSGDASLAGGTVDVDGPIGGNLRAAGERLTVNGSVGGDVHFAGDKIRLGPNARISGGVYYRSGGDLVADPGAEVSGGIRKATSDRAWPRMARGATIVGGITVSLGMVLLGAILVLGMPRFSREAGAAIRVKPWLAIGVGCAMLVGVPVALAVLVVTLVGIPLAILLAFAYVALLMLGYLIAAIFVGDFALERIDAQKLGSVWWRALFMVLAIVVIALVRQVPVAGDLAWWILFLAGVGAFTLRAWQGFKNDPLVA